MNLQEIFTYPYDNDLLLRRQKSLKRELLAREDVTYTSVRIALLCGSTIEDIKNILELFLLESGIKPSFYQSEYNKFYEDAVFGNSKLDVFQPEIIIVFTSVVNIVNWPSVADSKEEARAKVEMEYKRFCQVWEALRNRYHSVIVQNNFDFPYETSLGSLETVMEYGTQHFVTVLNEKFADFARSHDGFYLHDINRLSARIGLNAWHHRFQYCAYKFAMSYDVMPEVSLGLAKIIRAILGRNKKCLVLDLDNTLWGGIIGDGGIEGIQIGHETPCAEAYTAFQVYLQRLKQRGVILAVCSKNEEEIARSGFEHPDSVLHVGDFISFYANWEPKNVNLIAIAKEINVGTDSLVFIDDNPAERQIIRDTMPEVSVPEVDSEDVFSFIRAIEGAGYFEAITLSDEDFKRNAGYHENKARQELASETASYDEFLESLNMQAEIDSFCPIYFDRIAQLTGKTNQFNLTTRRYTQSEIKEIANDTNYITLYGRLTDKFGDNGLISVIIGEKIGRDLHIRLWIMSCRVLKRGMEQTMLDALVQKAREAGCCNLFGYYYPTKKNKIVENMYPSFGFSFVKKCEKGAVWLMPLVGYVNQGKYIVVKGVNG